MALEATNSIDVTDSAVFIPEIWSIEILAAYKQNLVMAQLVSELNHVGKKGDTIHIPKPTRGVAASKAANTVVNVQAFSSTEEVVLIDKHYHYARLHEDIVGLQALSSLMPFLTDDAGYALAKQVDTDIGALAATWGGDTGYGAAVIGSDGTTAYDEAASSNAAALTDAAIRNVIQKFDDGDVPTRNRVFVMPPLTKNTLLGTARFTEQAFTGEVGAGNSIRNGRVGDAYGVEFFMSSNVPSDEDARAVLFFQKDALVLAKQQNVRVQKQYKLEYLADLMVADTVYGVKTVRGSLSGDAGVGCQAIMVK